MFNKNLFIVLLCLLSLHCSSDKSLLVDDNLGYLNSELNFKGDITNLDIITWNIENFPKDILTIEYVNECVDSLNVDIIALQEIDNGSSLDILDEFLGSNWISFKSSSSLAYLVNTNNISIINTPYTILSQYWYDFASRLPYVLEFNYKNENFTLINIHFKCCDNDIDEPDNEDRRLASNQALHNYILNNLNNNNVLVVGDYNDTLIDNDNNIFEIFLNDPDFLFADFDIANGAYQYWSYPPYEQFGSHIDHILVTNELVDNIINTETILIDHSLAEEFYTYDYYISDHRPVGISLYFSD